MRAIFTCVHVFLISTSGAGAPIEGECKVVRWFLNLCRQLQHPGVPAYLIPYIAAGTQEVMPTL